MQVLANTSEYFARGFVFEYIVADILQQQQITLRLLRSIHNMHIGVFFAGKGHVYSFFGLFTYHRTRLLHCLLSDVLQAF